MRCFVITYDGGHYISAHLVGGLTLGYMIYIDDDYNVDVMKSTSKEFMSNVEASVGVKYEVSFNADTTSALDGLSKSSGYGVEIPLAGFGLGKGQSKSIDGSVTSSSGNVGYGYNILPIYMNKGESYNEIIMHFNPVEFIEKYLGVLVNNFKNNF